MILPKDFSDYPTGLAGIVLAYRTIYPLSASISGQRPLDTFWWSRTPEGGDYWYNMCFSEVYDGRFERKLIKQL